MLELSEKLSAAEFERLRFISFASSGSTDPMLRSCKPCCTFALARARRSWSALVICEE